jgi:hypothetical protein
MSRKPEKSRGKGLTSRGSRGEEKYNEITKHEEKNYNI